MGYLKQKSANERTLIPAKTIQRFWRGLRVSLRIMRWDNAAAKIQQTYRVYRWKLRSKKLLDATWRIQRVWLGAIHRKWLRHCHASATLIQKRVRANLVNLVLDREGRQKGLQYQAEMNALLKQKDSMSGTEYTARTTALAGKLRSELARHRETNLRLRQMPLLAAGRENKARRISMKGCVQPVRVSEFEPMVFALARMYQMFPQYGGQRSRILSMVTEAKKEIGRSFARENVRLSHAGARRGRAAVLAKRLSKKPQLPEAETPSFDEELFNRWAAQQFEPKRF